jgi:hypothetical protein
MGAVRTQENRLTRAHASRMLIAMRLVFYHR